MNFTNLKTYNESYDRAFEALCNQLFERWVRREYEGQLKHFATVRGDGGDGGVEAYAILTNEDVIGIQSKWFPFNIENSQVNQIQNSIKSAKKVRPKIKKYIVCLPKELASLTARNKDETNTEESRLNSFKDAVKEQYPDLELLFWDGHTLLCELQKPGNEGIHRFWFEKSELTQESLCRKFEIEKEGWLKERYIPELHLVGAAEWEIEKSLFTIKTRLDYIKGIDADLDKIKLANLLTDEFNRKVMGQSLNQSLIEIRNNLIEFEIKLSSIKDAIKSGAYIIPTVHLEEIDLWNTKLELERGNYGNPNRNLQVKLSHALETLHKANLPHWLNDFPQSIAPHNLILMGEPGSGKTHTLAYMVEQRLKQNLPAIIVQAKNSPCGSWSEIFRHATGGLSNWSFEEICSAFEALASRADSYRVMRREEGNLPDESSRVLIAIDGLDEAPIKENSKWKTRINELRAMAAQFPRLCFIVSCRTYGIQNNNPLGLDFDDKINRRFDLTNGLLTHSPVPGIRSKTEELAPHYLNTYEITYEGLHWLKSAFNTPLELKLFCENYRGRDISNILQPIHTTLKFLLGEKISRLEIEFMERFDTLWAKSEQVFKKSLLVIAEVFIKEKEVKHDDLCHEILTKTNGIIDRIWAGKILEFVTQHGILFQKRILVSDVLDTEQVIYETTYRSYIDYLIALKASFDIEKGRLKFLPDYLVKNKQNILNLTAISLLNDHSILIGEEGYWTESFSEVELHFMQYQALAEGSSEQIRARLPILEERFKTSRSDRASILQFLVLHLADNKALGLERNFIHKILSSYPNSFERDLIWSGDEYFDNDPEGIPSPSDVLRRIYYLKKWHTHEEQPLLFAWGLSCLDNNTRKHFRKELTKWGAWNISEFVKLLDLMFFCRDPQIQEDLATIALGIASLTRKSGNGLRELAKWMLQNVFDEKAVCQILNSVVRYGARAVVERAFQLGEITSLEVEQGRPPYCSNHDLLSMDLPVLTGQVSYPFGGDLDWYVIDRSHYGFLEYGFQGQFDPETAKILTAYHKRYGASFGPHEWSKAAAKAYILSLGFNRIDGSTMTKATHGAVSEVMTFEEKYVWLAVHQIQGYLADLIPHKDWPGAPAQMVQDYGRIVNVSNPIARQMLMTIAEVAEFGLTAQIEAEGKWFIPEEIAPTLIRTEKEVKEDLLNWVNTAQQPDFQQWIKTGTFFKNIRTKEPKEGIILYGYLSLAEPNKLGRTSLHQICFLMGSDLHAAFVGNFQDHVKMLWSYFDGLDSFEAGTKSTYISPDDVVWMDWVDEESSKLEIYLPNVSEIPFDIINTVAKIVDDDVTDGENYHHLPSKFLRKELGIVNMGYHSFFGNNGEQLAWSISSGKPFYDTQNFVFVDSKRFAEVLERNHLKPIWAFFQFKTTTAEFKMEYKNSHAQNCKLWIVWEEDGKYQQYLYQDGWFNKPYLE